MVFKCKTIFRPQSQMNMDGPEMFAGSFYPNSWCRVITNWVSFSSGCQYHAFILPTGVDWHHPVWTADVGPHEAFGVCRIESADAGSLGVSRRVLKSSLAFIEALHEHGWTPLNEVCNTGLHYIPGSAPRIAYLLRWVWYVLVWVWRKKTSHHFLCTCLKWSSYLQREREGDIAKVNLLRGKSSTSDQMNCHSFALPGWQSGILLQKLEFQPAVRNMD